MGRIAGALSDEEQHYQLFRDCLLGMRFMPAGRIQAAMGSTKVVTPYNCYVSGTIEDSFVEGHGSIMGRAAEAAATMRMGGGIGYDFSTLRPRGANIRKLSSHSSGPISFMEIFDAICRCVASSGHRRGAQMGVMRVDHPDIEEFIRAKQNEDKLTGFNISVGVTDEFMQCLALHQPFKLRFGGQVYKEVNAHALWETIMRSTWDWAEPGVLFIDTINRLNNLSYCETIAATNPCGEQPLPPHGACLLGSFNLVKYVTSGWIRGEAKLDYQQLASDIRVVVRAMDNVVDRAVYPLYEQEKEAKSKRRMGLGVTGLANALEALGHPYGSADFIAVTEDLLALLRDCAYESSALLAKEKGPFPLFRAEYMEAPMIRSLPQEIQALIGEHGIRNSHLISIAPTGTISLCADNVSSGIEPVFDYAVQRTVIGVDGPRAERIEDYGVREFGVHGRRATDVTAKEHLAVLKAVYPYVDSAVSKTCNVPTSMPWTDFKQLYVDAWTGGCKGCTTYRVGGKRGAVIVSTSEPSGPAEVGEGEVKACRIDPDTGRRDCD
jgi:ribonucleoside-diphosphate reductase alpha chain